MTYADAFNIRTTNVSFNSIADAIDGSLTRNWGGTSTGSPAAYAVSTTPPIASYVTGQIIAFTPHVTGTGAATINVNSLGVKNLTYKNKALVGGELVQNVESIAVYDGTNFEILNHGGGWATWTPSYGGSGGMTYTSVAAQILKYQRHGNRVDLIIEATGTTGGSPNASLTITLPVTAASTSGMLAASLYDSANYAGIGLITSTTMISVYKYDSSNWGIGGLRAMRVMGSYTA